MENTNAKTTVIKTLAIIGLLATIILAVWIMVQMARVIPTAFTSLASLTDSLNNYRQAEEFTIATEKSIVNSGDSFQISWTDLKRPGTYRFSYSCTEGVSADIRIGGKTITSLLCNQEIPLPTSVQTIDMIISSEKNRFSDVAFHISFKEDGTTDLSENQSGKVTIINATIPLSRELTPEAEKEADSVASDSTEGEATEDLSQSTPRAPLPARGTSVASVISFIPQSYENGFVDLSISYLGIGTYVNDLFVPSATINANTKGALRFAVKNIGTKTSDDWTFTTTLPSGFVYTSSAQAPLKPNEQAEFTLGFSPNTDAGAQQISGKVSEENDTKSSNDSFTWSVIVTE